MHLRIIRRGEALSVSEVLPTFEHFGLRVIAERPYRLSWPDGSCGVDAGFRARALRAAARRWYRAWRSELIAAFRAVRAGELDDDGFNRLLIAAELSMRQVTVLRACCRYLLQTGIPFSQSYMERVLGAHSQQRHATCANCSSSAWRRSPTPRRARCAPASSSSACARAIEAVVSPDEDRILRAFLAVILATLAHQLFSTRRRWSAAAVAGAEIRSGQDPWAARSRVPAFEIFVHSPRVEGVHLRKGPIARGGIRWSERPEDFRTEILGLMKAQHVKNTLIVPVGRQGRLRRAPAAAARARASCSSAR